MIPGITKTPISKLVQGILSPDMLYAMMNDIASTPKIITKSQYSPESQPSFLLDILLKLRFKKPPLLREGAELFDMLVVDWFGASQGRPHVASLFSLTAR
jgi:hypothetical protein